MMKREREALPEDLLAATSPDYLKSIQEARADVQAGRVKMQRRGLRRQAYGIQGLTPYV